jgi:hypothetical protein
VDVEKIGMKTSAEVRDDGLRTRLLIDGTEIAEMTAIETDEAIWALVAARAVMKPVRRPVFFPAMRIACGNGIHAENGENGRLLAVHHPGTGWVGAYVSDADVTAIREVFGPPKARRKVRPRTEAPARPARPRKPKV